LVDDVTIVADLDPTAPAPPGWHRILTDDPRLLRLISRTSDPGGSLETALEGVARLWDEHAERHGVIWRVESEGATIALATVAGGERERPCEIVTPPISADHEVALEELLAPARELRFTVPREAAVHLHVDGAAFREPAALANVIRLVAHWRAPLRSLLDSNAHCHRIAPLPGQLIDLVAGAPSFDELATAAQASGLTKFYDVNLTQLFREHPIRDTLEVRILPGAIHAAHVLERAAVVRALLDRCRDPRPLPMPPADPADAVRALVALADGAAVPA
jgi:hypothetical protein